MWDQYLLYGLQQSKRSRSDVISSSTNPEDHLPFLTMCLSKEEMRNNEYVVIQDDGLNSNSFSNRVTAIIEGRWLSLC